MKIRSDSRVLIVILAVTLLFVLYLFQYKSLKTILVPAIASGLILVLGTVQLRKELTAGAKSGIAEKADENKKQNNIGYLIGYAWLVGYTVAIYFVGFIYSSFLFLLFFFRFGAKLTWLKSGVLGILGTAIFWLSFVYWLQSDLWGGAIFNWFNLHLPTLTEL